MKIFYFTGTGNSLHVAKSLGGNLYSIPKVMGQDKFEFEADIIGIVFPCYALGLPRMVKEFLQNVKLKANYFFAIMTYGVVAGAGIKQIEKLAKKQGIKFDYINEIKMVDNYLPLFKMENQLKKEESKKITEAINALVDDIKRQKKNNLKKGILSRGISNLIYKFIYERKVDHHDKKFFVDDNCKSCKICEKVCPKNNIMFEKKPEFMHKCDGCYSCIHNCPNVAIHHKNEKNNSRFRNKNVTLMEIILANNQK